jgi:hypothetical protein
VLASVLLGLGSSLSQAAATDLELESADAVNEGPLHFLAAPPAKPVHHHQNHIRIDPASLASGWVGLSQCHDHLDAVPRAQITFRQGFVRDLRIDVASRIGAAWVEGASVQLQDVEPGARLCLSAQTRALRSAGQGAFNLVNGPYLRKFLDGYYPMRVTLEVDYPQQTLRLIRVSPPLQPGLTVAEGPGTIRLDALFEGELRTLIEFRQHDHRE